MVDRYKDEGVRTFQSGIALQHVEPNWKMLKEAETSKYPARLFQQC